MREHQAIAADVYCRLSLAIMGDTTKVDDQERICRELAAARGWAVSEVHKDNSRSAWQRDRKRPGWDAMLERVDRNQANAIIVYHGDRLIRQPWDLEKLLNLASGKGILLASPTGVRDLGNADDQFVLRIEAAMACRESDNISRRTRAGHERRRRGGYTRPGGRGGRAYAFASDGITQIPGEAQVVRLIAGRLIAGHGTSQICRDLNAAGHTTVTGGPWQPGPVRKMIARPRYAGLMPDGDAKGAWEPVLDRETWEDACAVLRSRAAGFPYATNARRYLLSGLALCGTCGHPVAIRHNTRSESLRGYGCINPGCALKVHRKAAPADEHVSGYVVAVLNRPGFLARMEETAARPHVTAEIIRLERLRDGTRAELEAMDDLPPVVVAAAARGMARYDERIAALRDRLASEPGRRLAGAYAGITRERFLDIPLAERRVLVATLVTVTILPSARRGPGFDPESVRVTPK